MEGISPGLTSPFRAAIVGCGRIGGLHQTPASMAIETHAKAYDANPMTTLVGACDSDTGRRVQFAAAWSVPVFDSIEALLDATRPAIVSVTSPSGRHFEHIMSLLRYPNRPRAVFAEKPVCTDPAQLVSLTAFAQSARATVLVNHTRRFDPAHQQLAAAIHRGEFGALVEGHADYYGGWVQNGTHLVDVLRMLLGDVECVGATKGTAGRGDDDCPVVHLTARGALIVASGFDESRYQLFEIDLRFERARVLLEDFGSLIRLQPVEVNAIGERVLAVTREQRIAGLQEPLRHAVDAIVGDLTGRTRLAATGASLQDAADTMHVVWQARAACRC